MENDTRKKQTLELISRVVEMAYDEGLVDGIELGKQLGFVAGVTSLKAALACGLRHGSPECGKAVEGLKRLGLTG